MSVNKFIALILNDYFPCHIFLDRLVYFAKTLIQYNAQAANCGVQYSNQLKLVRSQILFG